MRSSPDTFNSRVSRNSLNDDDSRFITGSIDSMSTMAIGVNGYIKYDLHPRPSGTGDVYHLAR